jgi:hypothetical protein
LSIAFKSITEVHFSGEFVESGLSYMTEWRMTQIVGETRCLYHIRTKVRFRKFPGFNLPTQLFGYSPSKLRDLQRVSQPVVEHVSLVGGHDYRHPRQAAEGGGVKNSVSVPLERVAIVGYFIGFEPRGASYDLRLPCDFPISSEENAIPIRSELNNPVSEQSPNEISGYRITETPFMEHCQ